MSINWKILNLDCIPNKDGLENIVVKINFECSIVEDVDGIIYSASTVGVSTLDSPNPNNFTLYNNITKEQIIEWIKNSREYKPTMQHIQKIVSDLKKPQTVTLNPPFTE